MLFRLILEFLVFLSFCLSSVEFFFKGNILEIFFKEYYQRVR